MVTPAILSLWEYHVSRKSLRAIGDLNVIEIHVVILLIDLLSNPSIGVKFTEFSFVFQTSSFRQLFRSRHNTRRPSRRRLS